MNLKEMLAVVAVLVTTVVLVVVMTLVGPTAAALAEPAQQLGFQLSADKPGGQVTFHLQLRTYDTAGGVPPAPTAFHLRLPHGAAIRKQFLEGPWFCDGPALRDALDAHLSASGTPFADRVANLKPFIRELAGSRAKRDRAALANARACERARIGGGTGLIDARRAIKAFSDPIPIKFSQFLSRGRGPGAIAGFTILGSADERSPLVRRYPVVAGVHAAITQSIVDDPTPDGLYGYKVLLPTGPIAGFDVSLAAVDATVHAPKLAKGTCLKRNRRGQCVRRQRTDLFGFVVPACPPSGQLSVELFTAFAAPTPSLTTTLPLPCPRFSS